MRNRFGKSCAIFRNSNQGKIDMKMISPDPHHVHSLRVVVEMTGCPPRKIFFYCRQGVVRPVSEEDDEWFFDQESVMRLRHIEVLRQQHRMNWAAIRTIIGLLDEVETLREELRWRR
mgnify:CR=1 FL=1